MFPCGVLILVLALVSICIIQVYYKFKSVDFIKKMFHVYYNIKNILFPDSSENDDNIHDMPNTSSVFPGKNILY